MGTKKILIFYILFVLCFSIIVPLGLNVSAGPSCKEIRFAAIDVCNSSGIAVSVDTNSLFIHESSHINLLHESDRFCEVFHSNNNSLLLAFKEDRPPRI